MMGHSQIRNISVCYQPTLHLPRPFKVWECVGFHQKNHLSFCKTHHQCSAKNRKRQSSVVSGESKPGASGDFESQATQSQASHFWQPLWDATLAVRMKFRLSMCQWHTQQKTAAECTTHFLNTGKTCQYNEEPMKNHKWWLILVTERVLTTK